MASSTAMKGVTQSQVQHTIHRVLKAIKAGRYNLCQNIVDQGLKYAPDDHDLLFIRAFLNNNTSYLKNVNKNNVSADVRQICVDHLDNQISHTDHTLERYNQDALQLSMQAKSQKYIISEYYDPMGVAGALAGSTHSGEKKIAAHKEILSLVTYGGIIVMVIALVLFWMNESLWSVALLLGGITAIVLKRLKRHN